MSCRGKNIHYAKLKLELHEVGTAVLILDSSLNTEQAADQVQTVNCSFAGFGSAQSGGEAAGLGRWSRECY